MLVRRNLGELRCSVTALIALEITFSYGAFLASYTPIPVMALIMLERRQLHAKSFMPSTSKKLRGHRSQFAYGQECMGHTLHTVKNG